MVHRKVGRDDAEAGAVAPAYTHRLDLEPIPKFKMPLVGRAARGRLPPDPRRAPPRRQLATEPRDVRHDVDGARGRPSDGRGVRQEHDRQGRVPADRRDRAPLREHGRPPVPRARRSGADAVGASTIGSSEAVMLAGLAMKWRWRARRERPRASRPTAPNLILGSNVQVVWEKFCRYWDVEPRYIPVHEGAVRDRARRGRSRGSTRTRSAWSRSSARRTRESSSRSRRSTMRSSRTTPRRGSTCRCTSTRRAAGSSRRSCTRISSGTSGCRRS